MSEKVALAIEHLKEIILKRESEIKAKDIKIQSLEEQLKTLYEYETLFLEKIDYIAGQFATIDNLKAKLEKEVEFVSQLYNTGLRARQRTDDSIPTRIPTRIQRVAK